MQYGTLQLVTHIFKSWGCTTLTPSELHKHTNQQFLDELIEVHTTLSVRHLNLIINDDLNVHYLMEKDDSEQFKSMMEAVALIQKVTFDMHVMGNILDLIFVEQVGNIKISNDKEGPMFSDHKSVECEIEIQKSETSKQSKTFRNWKKIRYNQILCQAKP